MMKLWLLFSFLPILAFIQSAQVDVHALADQAAAAYEAGDYANAINLYRALLDSGVHDSRIYFNLGNAYFQSNNLGLALLNYRRAQQLSPRDSEIHQYLNMVRSRRIDIQGDELFWLDGLATISIAVLAYQELSWIVLALWSVFFACLIAWIPAHHWRTTLRPALIGISMLLVITLGLWIARGYAESNRPAAVVIENTVTVMSGPGQDYLELYTLYGAAEMRLLETRGDWLRFTLPDQRQGWIPQAAVEKV